MCTFDYVHASTTLLKIEPNGSHSERHDQNHRLRFGNVKEIFISTSLLGALVGGDNDGNDIEQLENRVEVYRNRRQLAQYNRFFLVAHHLYQI